MCRIILLGSGSLAQSVAYSLAVGDIREPLDVTVVARRDDAATRLCGIANLRATGAGRPVRFRPVIRDLDHPALLDSPEPLLGVVLCASRQSPWEGVRRPSAWSRLLAAAGYGLSLPLQAEPAVGVGRAAADRGAWFVNACLPDLVNPLLAALDIPVRCGIGNASTLATALQHALGVDDAQELALLAHHLHLHAPPEEDEARAWRAGRPVAGIGRLLTAVRRLGRAELNKVTGYVGARVIIAMVTGETLHTSLPGPSGLPGGYPVRLSEGEITLRLPEGLSAQEAVAANVRWSLADGAVVKGGRVIFGISASAALAGAVPEISDGFAVTDTADACKLLLGLRTRLRANVGGIS